MAVEQTHETEVCGWSKFNTSLKEELPSNEKLVAIIDSLLFQINILFCFERFTSRLTSAGAGGNIKKHILVIDIRKY